VEFCSAASNLVAGDTNGVWDVFVRDRQSGTTERQSVSSLGVQAEVMAGYYGLDMSADGSLRVFDSHANQLVPDDTSASTNTFLHYATGSAPVAAFSAAPTSGPPPLAVQFADASTGSPTSCSWDFGDGGTSTEKDPAHVYAAAGRYTVGMTATNQYGSATEVKPDYISVALPDHTLTVNADPAAGGTVTGGGSYPQGTVVTVTATAASGYTFANWTGPVADPNAAATTVTVTSDLSVAAHFSITPSANYALTVNADPAAGGTVTDGGTYPQGTVVSVTAAPAAGYVFLNWTGPVANATATATVVTMANDLVVTAHFRPAWLEDTDPAIVYTGPWTLAENAAASAGHFTYSVKKSAQTALTFTGTSISWHTLQGPGMGMAKVSVDGGRPEVVDLYAASDGPGTIDMSGLSAGSHTLVIRVAGQSNPLSAGIMVAMDALEVML
jgi:uncharacterized repeat protein (TIGR02543 family)